MGDNVGPDPDESCWRCDRPQPVQLVFCDVHGWVCADCIAADTHCPCFDEGV